MNRKAIIMSMFLLATLLLTAFSAQNDAPAIDDGDSPQYSDALAMQYAQPWLEASVARPVYSDALAMQYVQPWLDKPVAELPKISNALAMQYAQPWLDAMGDNVETLTQ